jgi:alkanesulfonate monooxygenase SsuD/methylene tetrahydromethanopterin reductase-like flavin-dependent oxidoreductase (luciferase family)
MKYDIFFSISQTEVDGFTPNSTEMFENFFDQVKLADELGFGTAWVAETHLSCQTQKKTTLAVVPEFKGEIGLNTDILQLALSVFDQTKNIKVGSAIRNIICNGGPIAHAEALKTFMTLKQFTPHKNRGLEFGFAAGRFDFSNAPFGVSARKDWERSFWHMVKSKALEEAVEIFMRLLSGEELSSKMIGIKHLSQEDFRTADDWEKAKKLAEIDGDFKDDKIFIDKFYEFEKLSLIPLEADMSSLQLTVGTHDPKVQQLCNEFYPTRVFNLSITPPKVIEETHERMNKVYHEDGGPWHRSYMPRTAMVFMDDSEGSSEEDKNKKAEKKARSAWENYWKAMAGTIDQNKIDSAVDNTIFGSPKQVAQKIQEKYDKDDRLMLWFDFNNHDNSDVKDSMKIFKEKCIPLIENQMES